MKKIPLLFLAATLSGCVGTPPKVPDPVVVTVKEKVEVDPSLMVPCEYPAFMPGPLTQAENLKFAQGEAIKLILCGKKHRALADAISKAFNVSSPEIPSKTIQNEQK